MLEAPPAKAYVRTEPHSLAGAAVLTGLLVAGLIAIEHPLVVAATVGILLATRWIGQRLSYQRRRRDVFGRVENHRRPRAHVP